MFILWLTYKRKVGELNSVTKVDVQSKMNNKILVQKNNIPMSIGDIIKTGSFLSTSPYDCLIHFTVVEIPDRAIYPLAALTCFPFITKRE